MLKPTRKKRGGLLFHICGGGGRKGERDSTVKKWRSEKLCP